MTNVVRTSAGRTATRFLVAHALGADDVVASVGYAQARGWADVYPIVGALKATVGGHTAADDASLRSVGADLQALWRPMSITGRLPLRRVPADTPMLTAVVGATGSFVGEGQAVPLSAAGYVRETMRTLKVVSICAATLELLRLSDTDAEAALAADLGEANAAAEDLAFLDPNNAGEADVRPESITHGVAPFTGEDLDVSLAAAIDALVAAGSTLASAFWIMRPDTAVHLLLRRAVDGSLAYPKVSAIGGELIGLPVLTTANLPRDSDGDTIVLVDARGITFTSEPAELTTSRQGAIQMRDDPTGSSVDGTATTLTSLWQTDAVALKTTQRVNWRVRVAGSVQLVVVGAE